MTTTQYGHCKDCDAVFPDPEAAAEHRSATLALVPDDLPTRKSHTTLIDTPTHAENITSYVAGSIQYALEQYPTIDPFTLEVEVTDDATWEAAHDLVRRVEHGTMTASEVHAELTSRHPAFVEAWTQAAYEELDWEAPPEVSPDQFAIDLEVGA